ncbi:amino acid transporter [Penicillium malachiteum]|uniref:amino acid transporter n=1 Tax=Penicillium malachiteum TaxID=1324776 RepID=UPI002548596C|nr:amino acid transporter [Penicillium malachiteum]KAJ5726081.1 amino acid transporter [Penicillium malachiteum]
MPNAAGQSFWAKELSPKKFSRLASYITGWLAWTGSIFASSSVASGVASACVGCYAMAHPELYVCLFKYPQTTHTNYCSYSNWKSCHTLVAYEAANIFCFFFNAYWRTLSVIGHAYLYVSLGSFIVILIAVPARAQPHKSAEFVFASFSNETGWKSDVLAFFVGLINTNWGFGCLDTAVHLAEEISQPERMIPIAIMGVIVIGFITSFSFILAMLFSIQIYTAFLDASVPSLELFRQALDNTAGATVLESLTIATGPGCLISCHTWAARLCWSFSRNKGVPFSDVWGKIVPSLDTPLAAHILNTTIIGLVGCIYLGSETAFNSMVTACIDLQYLSYVLPVVGILIRGRNNISHGPFWLGTWGLICNWVCLAWIAFTTVFYSFPSIMPVDGGNMNYVSVIYGIVGFIILADWVLRARKTYLTNICPA